MRRAVPVLLATILGSLLLLNFHSTPGQVAVATENGSASSVAPAVAPPSGAPPGDDEGAPASSSTPPTSSTGGSGQRVFDGSDEFNRFGDVQVRVTVSGSRIVDVQATKLPFDRERSAEISDYAAPRLRQEVLQAQSAQIDTVTGATYTSDSYARSLQAALDKAGIH